MKLNVAPLIRQYVLVVTVNLAVLTTGMSISWPSPMLVKLQNSTETPLPRPVTENEGSWIVSAGFLLGIFFSISGGTLVDVIGRKYSLLLLSISKLCMALLLIFAKKLWIVILSRTVMIAGDCLLVIIVPIYASEIASKDHRGALGTFLQLFSSVGVLISLSVGPFMSYNGFSIVFTSIIAVTTVPLLFLPDTPFYMYSKGRIDDAIKALTLIRGSDILANQELEEYKATSKGNQQKVDRKALLKNKTFLKSLSLGLLLVVSSQLTGFNAISYYLQTILESTKTNVMPEIASVIIGAIQVVASFCTTFVTNKFGRRPILLTSLIGIFLGLLGLGTFFQITASAGYRVIGFLNFLPIISLIFVVYSYCIGIGSLVWLVIPELFDGPDRAFGVSISFTSSAFLIFLTSKYFATLTLAMGPAATYWFFSSTCAFVFVLIAIFVPETKGKTFNEIQIALGKEKDIQFSIEVNNKV